MVSEVLRKICFPAAVAVFLCFFQYGSAAEVHSRDSVDMDFEMRGSFRAESLAKGDMSYGFRVDRFRWNVEGTVGNKVGWRFRQSFKPDSRLNTLDNILSTVDYAYVRWSPSHKLSLTAGKQMLAFGGYEFQASSIYVIEFSDFWGTFGAYQAGIPAGLDLGHGQELLFQVSNLKGLNDAEYYYGGFPAGLKPSSFPAICTVNWNGSFLEKKNLGFRYSASWGSQAGGRSLQVISGGQTYRNSLFGTYLDFVYSRQGLDFNSILSRSAALSGAGKVTLENAEYFSAIGYVHFFISKSFSAFAKGVLEFGGISGKSGGILSDICRVSQNAQACVEYMPTKDRDTFRLFLHYNYYHASPYGDGGLALGFVPRNEHRLSLGVIFTVNVL